MEMISDELHKYIAWSNDRKDGLNNTERGGKRKTGSFFAKKWEKIQFTVETP